MQLFNLTQKPDLEAIQTDLCAIPTGEHGVLRSVIEGDTAKADDRPEWREFPAFYNSVPNRTDRGLPTSHTIQHWPTPECRAIVRRE